MYTQELEKHIRFEEKLSSYLYSYTNSGINIPYRFWYIPIFTKLLFEESLNQVIKELGIRVRRCLRYLTHKEKVGILVDSLDKGGMEGSIYNLCHNLKGFKPVIFITGSEYGAIGFKLVSEGYAVYVLDNDFKKFKDIVSDKKTKLINSHFTTWNFKNIHDLNLSMVYVIHNMYTWFSADEIQTRKESYKYVNAFIAVSKPVKDYFSNKFEIDAKKITVIENGFDEKTAPRPDKGIKREKTYINILNVASYATLKNQALLIQSFAEVYKANKKVRLILVGNTLDNEYFDFIKSLVKKLKLEKVIKLAGFLEKEEISKLYTASNIFVLSSLQEGAPNVLLEALYYQIPIISTNVGNASTLLHNRGIVISNPYKNLYDTSIEELVNYAYHPKSSCVRELSKAIERMINDYNHYQKTSETNRLFIKQNYSLSRVVAKYEQIFFKRL